MSEAKFQEWPKMVYKVNEVPRVVQNQAELDKLGTGWKLAPVPGGLSGDPPPIIPRQPIQK